MFTNFGRFALLASIALSPSAATSAEKKPTPASRIVTARAMYYTPTTAGLRSFHCDGPYEWKDFLTRFSGSEVAEDNPMLKYFQTVRLSVSNDLKTGGQLEWADSGVPPEGHEKNVAQVRDGMKQMLSGFFTSWNAYMNGSMVPVPDSPTEVTEEHEGLHLHLVPDKTTTVDEFFDKDVLLTSVHVLTSDMDIIAYPTFTKTPQGLLISDVRSEIRQPTTAPVTTISMITTYGMQDGFQLPTQVKFDEQNVGIFYFPFKNCSVTQTLTLGKTP